MNMPTRSIVSQSLAGVRVDFDMRQSMESRPFKPKSLSPSPSTNLNTGRLGLIHRDRDSKKQVSVKVSVLRGRGEYLMLKTRFRDLPHRAFHLGNLCGNLAVLAGEEFFKGLASEAGHFFCSRQQAFDTQVAIQSLPVQGVIENFHLQTLCLGC